LKKYTHYTCVTWNTHVNIQTYRPHITNTERKTYTERKTEIEREIERERKKEREREKDKDKDLGKHEHAREDALDAHEEAEHDVYLLVTWDGDL
jgi:hypothetical protein